MEFDRAKDAQHQRRLAVMLLLLIASMVFVVWFTVIGFVVEPDQTTDSTPTVQTKTQSSTESQADARLDPAVDATRDAGAADPPAVCEDPMSAAPECVARREALVTWSKIDTVVDTLMEKQAVYWATERFSAAIKDYERGVQAFNENRFQDAYDSLSAVLLTMNELDQLSSEILSDAIASGWDAIENEQSEDAIKSFELALLIDPENDSGQEGLARASVMDDVLALYYKGVTTEQGGRLEEAKSLFDEASLIDPQNEKVRSAVQALTAKIRDANFGRALSQGLVQLERKEAAQALQSFQQALAIKPGSAEALAGIERASILDQSQSISRLLQDAESAHEREEWETSRALYAEVLAQDPSVEGAIKGKGEVDALLDVEAEITGLTDRPFRLSSKAVFDYAADVLSRAEELAPGWDRLEVRADELAILMEDMQTPVSLTVRSDGQTEVTIQRIGNLGTLDEQSFEILPGNYVIEGRRRGYREVRHEIEVSPGSVPLLVTVVCDESF